MRFSLTTVVSSMLLGSAVASPVAVTIEDRDIEGRAVPIGQAIFKCTTPGTIALTFDDGPFQYTQRAMDLLRDGGNMKATFFVNGQNRDSVLNRRPAIERMLRENHQIGHHTWSHPFLTQVSNAEVRKQMIDLENTLFDMTGRFPTYMRPPYFDYNQNTLNIMRDLGYKVIIADIDTKDFETNSPSNYQVAVTKFREGVAKGGSISLAHDIHEGTVNLILPEMIKIVRQRGLRAVTVGECLGDAPSNWYRYAKRASTAAPPTTQPPTGVVGPGGQCGGSNKWMCASGLCCSQYGWCGDTAQYCANGCQRAFGRCN